MTLTERLRTALLRWDRLVAVAAIALPFLVAMLAGFAWMIEHGWLIPFIAGSIGLGGAVGLLRLVIGWWRSRGSEAEAPSPQKLHARVNPDWSAKEQHAFAAACALIAERTAAPVPWEELGDLSFQVIDCVAKASGEKGKDVWTFTIPEALLLADRVAVRLRANIRGHVPFADSISVGTLRWLWAHRELARKFRTHGKTAWRVFRAIKSLPIAILREIEGAIAEGHTSFVTGEGTAVLQALLLEEVAAAAVELYSGRLRFSDAELLDRRREEFNEDRARLATSDAPLRIAVAGQVSVGKSSLINALLARDVAETDVIPTTDRPKAYPADFNGVAVVLLDMPGLDGSKRVTNTVLDELCSADLVLWTVRASRPAREIDHAALAKLKQFFAAHPERRMPQVIVVVTCIDEILKGWPFPENLLGEAAMALVVDVVAAVATDLGDSDANLVPVVLAEPNWHVSTLRDRIDGRLSEALMTQRNRQRVEGRKTGVLREMSRAGRGLRQGAAIFSARKDHKDD